MDEIIDTILAMPALTLEDSEWELAAKILGNLTNKSPDSFKATLDLWLKCNQSASFDSIRLDNFLNYLKCWNEVNSLLNTKMERVCAVWTNTFFKDLSAEDLLPVLVELITYDEGKLKKLNHKINVALKLHDYSREAYTLTSLQIAAAFKLENKPAVSDKDKAEFEKIHRQVEVIQAYLPTAAEEVNRQRLLHQRHIICNEYKNELAEKIKTKLIKENKLRFQPVFNESKSDHFDHTILEIINNNHLLIMNRQKKTTENIEESSSKALVVSNEIIDSDILLLFEKFKAIYDLFATCSQRKKKTSEAKLEEFSEKYLMYKDILDANGDQIGMKILKAVTLVTAIEQLAMLLPEFIRKPTNEERFSQSAGLFTSPRAASTNKGIVAVVPAKARIH